MWTNEQIAELIIVGGQSVSILGALYYSKKKAIQILILCSLVFSILFTINTNVNSDIFSYQPWFELNIMMYILSMVLFAAMALSQSGMYWRWLTMNYCVSGFGVSLALMQNVDVVVIVYDYLRVTISITECVVAWMASNDSRRESD